MSITINQNFVQGTKSFNQIYQTHSVKFAPVNVSNNKKEAILITYPFKCRDFFIEAALSHNYKAPFSIYGFQIDCSKTDWVSGNTSMLIDFPNKEHKENFLKNLTILNFLENTINIDKTQVIDVEGDEKSIIVIGDNVWKTKGFLISLYSFLLKCLIFDIDHNSDVFWLFQIPKNSTEAERIKDIGEEKFSKFYKNLGKIIHIEGNVTGYKDELEMEIYDLHDESGFVSILTLNQDDVCGENKYINEIEEIID